MPKPIRISINNKRSLLDQLRDRNLYIPAYCGGQGTCGKCRVRFVKEAPEATRIDLAALSDDELADGWRLACGLYADGLFELEMADPGEDHMEAVDSFSLLSDKDRKGAAGEKSADETGNPGGSPGEASAGNLGDNSGGCGLALDIGTTTLVASLLDLKKKQTVKTAARINHQRGYGADVLSRIHASNQGHGKELQRTLLDDLSSLCRQLGIGDDVEKLSIPVIVSGNTTMEHLLQGLSCRKLGAYPFTPVDISLHIYKNMTILPGISTYVGADMVSGIAACGMDRAEEVSILVDLGTNGEMAIGNKDKILVTSAAAGPAFEGGNIRCGTAGIPGAIDRVSIEKGKTRIRTIGGEKAVGICGSGVLEVVYELLKEKIIDRTGLLDDAYFDQGYPLAPGILFSAQDIRQVQLAKSAIRAGIEILLQSWGISAHQVSRLYLAGGFGQKINSKKALGIGLLPADLSDRILAVGNSSLEGAKMLAFDPAFSGRLEHITEISEEILLAKHAHFQDLYLEYMNFDL